MSRSHVERIADAVLYEGYILYPYRPSAVKNQQRWNFGALCPKSYSLAQRGTERWSMQTECLVQSSAETVLEVKVRFLQLLTREVSVPNADVGFPISDLAREEIQTSISESDFRVVPSLEVNGQLFQTWQEAVERDVVLPGIRLVNSNSDAQPQRLMFSLPATQTIKPLRDENGGEILGLLVRRQQAMEGALEIRISEIGLRNDELAPGLPETKHLLSEGPDPPAGSKTQPKNLLKITVEILNLTPLEDAGEKSRDEALMRSLVSTHTILNVRDGEFVSLLDPPDAFREAAAGCGNIGTYPVLVGEEGARDCMLSSPIILYDYPQIAPESAGNLFDGTEIDEILTLRIMTLTEEEKREMRGADERARQILERTETLPLEQLMKMHGAMKGVNRKS